MDMDVWTLWNECIPQPSRHYFYSAGSGLNVATSSIKQETYHPFSHHNVSLMTMNSYVCGEWDPFAYSSWTLWRRSVTRSANQWILLVKWLLGIKSCCWPLSWCLIHIRGHQLVWGRPWFGKIWHNLLHITTLVSPFNRQYTGRHHSWVILAFTFADIYVFDIVMVSHLPVNLFVKHIAVSWPGWVGWDLRN